MGSSPARPTCARLTRARPRLLFTDVGRGGVQQTDGQHVPRERTLLPVQGRLACRNTLGTRLRFDRPVENPVTGSSRDPDCG